MPQMQATADWLRQMRSRGTAHSVVPRLVRVARSESSKGVVVALQAGNHALRRLRACHTRTQGVPTGIYCHSSIKGKPSHSPRTAVYRPRLDTRRTSPSLKLGRSHIANAVCR